ncbi:MAG: hypothetical protein ABIY52_07630 [Gemmatimonadaceae bacterium]
MTTHTTSVALCIEGIQAEMRGERDEARALYERAWEMRADDYDACVAAHYIARQQPTPEDTLAWNLKSLKLASTVSVDRISGFLPSLYLNVGHSYEMLGDIANAHEHYEHAASHLDTLPADAYGDLVRQGIAAGLERLLSAE